MLSEWQISPAALLAQDWTALRRIGRLTRARGVQALRVPSAAVPDTDNLVIYLDQLARRPAVLASTAVDLSQFTWLK